MTVDGVKEPGEAEAEHGAQEEHPEDHLLLQSYPINGAISMC